MRFGEVLKNIRIEKNDSLRKLADKIGVAFTYIDQIEKGKKTASKAFFEKILQIYSDKKDELTKTYLEQVLPQEAKTELNKKLEIQKVDIRKFKTKVYKYNSRKNGISITEYIYKEMVVPMFINIKENDFGVEIIGNELKNFYNDDTLLVEKTDDAIEMLNKKIVVVEIDNILYIRKVNIKNYTIYLESLNTAYKPIKYSADIKIVGVVSGLVYRNLKNINF